MISEAFFRKKFFLLFLTLGIVWFVSVFCLCKDTNAYTVEVNLTGKLYCEEKTTTIDCYVEVGPDRYLTMNNYDWDYEAQVRVEVSSSYRSSEDYYLGYRVSWSDELQDRRYYNKTYEFSINKSDFKRSATREDMGSYIKYSKNICVDFYGYWTYTGASASWNSCYTPFWITETKYRTLKVFAFSADDDDKDSGGNYKKLNGGNPVISREVVYGGSSTVKKSEFNFSTTALPSRYEWYKWGANGLCASSGTATSCTISNITANPTSVNAYYRKKNFILTAKGKIMGDTSTIVWSNLGAGSSATVNRGASASVTVPSSRTNNGKNYEFAQWGASCDGTIDNPNRKCTINPLNGDKVVYAYYRLMRRTLTAHGKIVGGGEVVWENLDSTTVDDGSSASVTVGSELMKDGKYYEFDHWDTETCNGTRDNTNRKCTINPLNNNKEVYAYYKPVVRTLTAHGKRVEDDAILWRDLDSVTVDKGASASVTVGDRKRSGEDQYRFVYWDSGTCNGIRDNENRICTINPLNNSKEVYAYYEREVVLKAYARSLDRDRNGNYIELNSGMPIDSDTVLRGEDATVTSSRYNPEGYTWFRWGDSCDREPGRDCTKRALTASQDVYAYYQKNEFSGRVRVMDGVSTSGTLLETTGNAGNGYVESDETKTIEVDCPENGCDVTYDLYLKTEKGNGTTIYSEYREEDGSRSAYTLNRLIRPSNDGTEIRTITERLYPGHIVCHEINFITVPIYNRSAGLKICVAAVATEDSDIDIKLRDERSSAQYRDSGWNKNLSEVYAKPMDIVDFRGTFAPRYQYLKDSTPSKTKVIGINEYTNNGSTIEEVFNRIKDERSGWKDWNNAFSFVFNNSSCKKSIFGRTGSSALYGHESDQIYSYPITISDVGTDISAKAATNLCASAKNTPKSASIDYDDGVGFIGQVDNGSMSSRDVHVKTPYNFVNDTYVNSFSDNEVAYAGESKTIIYTLQVKAKNNELTGGEYATQVPNARWGIRVKYDDDGWSDFLEYGSGTLNDSTNLGGYHYGGDDITKNVTIDIEDVRAGTRICVKSWVWPANSGVDSNLDVSGFTDAIVESDREECFTVAKKPSFQVWGGDLGVDGDAHAAVSNKKKLAGYDDGTHIFGSWTELGLIVSGESTGIASGASTGYKINYGNGTLWPAVTPANGLGNNTSIDGRSPGGIDVSSFCARSVLSLANGNCSGGSVGFGGSSFSGSANHLGIIADLVSDEVGDVGSMNLSEDGGASYYYQSGDITIGSATIRKGNTKLVRSDGNINIVGNIEYEDVAYSAMEDIPKLVVYAGGDIVIDCTVSRIDAILISEDTVHTCNDVNVNASERSTQLRINGSIVANKLDLGRTYGAATGANSMVPAEIINYDSSVYLWADRQTDITTTSSSKLVEAYRHELSPRY